MLETHFPPSEVAAKIAVSLGIGLLVGIEREWSNKDLGIRTFALTALFGNIAALFEPSMATMSLVGVFLIIIFANARSLLVDRSLETTTSAALLVIFVLGALVGRGHLFTPVAAAILTTMLLAGGSEVLDGMRLDLSAENVRELAQTNVFSSDSHRAFIVSSDAAYGFARAFENLRERMGEHGIRVFRDLEDALLWVFSEKESDSIFGKFAPRS